MSIQGDTSTPPYAMPRRLTQICQFFLFPFLRLLALIFVKCPLTFETIPPYVFQNLVVAANHQSRLDPLVICGALPWKVYRQLPPLYFMTANGYLNRRLTKSFLLACGCFPSQPHLRYGSGVSQAAFLLTRGANVWIFPEGRRTLPGVTPPRKGVVALSSIDGVHLLPIRIQWIKKSRYQRSAQIGIGKPLAASGKSATQIMDIIYSLSLKD